MIILTAPQDESRQKGVSESLSEYQLHTHSGKRLTAACVLLVKVGGVNDGKVDVLDLLLPVLAPLVVAPVLEDPKLIVVEGAVYFAVSVTPDVVTDGGAENVLDPLEVLSDTVGSTVVEEEDDHQPIFQYLIATESNLISTIFSNSNTYDLNTAPHM